MPAAAGPDNPVDSDGRKPVAVPGGSCQGDVMASSDTEPKESKSLPELRLRRCFTFKHQIYSSILNALKKHSRRK